MPGDDDRILPFFEPTGMARPRYTPERIIDALKETNGLIFLAAERLGCTSATVINYMNKHPSIRQAVEDRRGRRVDKGEAKLDAAVENGEGWAVQFLLRTQGKDRGYGDTTKLVGGGKNGEIIIASVGGEATVEDLLP